MVLEFTLIGGLTVGTEKQGVRILLIGAIGCNIAWGIIDGALYAMGNLTARRQRLRFLSNLRNAPDESTAFSIISGKLDPLLEPATSTEDRARICQTLLPVLSRVQLPEGGIMKDDVFGMIAVFLINVVSVVPAVIPFLIVSQPHRALRISNALLIATLFAAGFMWGKYIHVNRYVTAGCAVLIGLALVGVAIALGG
jgi:VIT1/CCC1 family predicted Fe2+/Mn2+ transporter